MQCPVCLEPMNTFTFFNVDVDSCKFCGGVWLDPGELASYIKRGNIPKKILSGYCLDDSARKVNEGQRKCPRCNVVMSVCNHKNVNVDVCQGCNGIWFDRGELMSIMKEYYKDYKKGKKGGFSTVQTTYDASGDEIVKITDDELADLAEEEDIFSENYGKENAFSQIEQEFMSAGGADQAIKALPRKTLDRIEKKSRLQSNTQAAYGALNSAPPGPFQTPAQQNKPSSSFDKPFVPIKKGKRLHGRGGAREDHAYRTEQVQSQNGGFLAQAVFAFTESLFTSTTEW